LQQSGTDLHIEVRDNGRGFPVEIVEQQMERAIRTNEDLPVSFGISTLRHQLSLYGGSVEIQSAPGAGTQIILIVPIYENVQKA
jgi:two-component system sensor histidine kinase UhpB